MSETPSENGPVEPARHLLADNGVVPNSALPALVYKQAAPQRSDLDDWFRTTFAENRWVGARDDMLSDTDHYHSTAFAVFGVVIFFWVSFHQNGYSLTYFARDYVNLDVININLGFTTIKGAEIFQSVNPFFVVTLTPLIMWFFGWLRKRNIEVSTPMKIAIGMGIAATAYLFLMFFSFALPDKAALAGMKADQVQSILVTPWVMVGLYFILTVAELFISPLGLAFVSKVAPPHMQGLMQGFWLAATAVGNALLFVGGWLYMHTPMWATWCVFVAACGMSMLVMLSMVRWLERVTK